MLKGKTAVVTGSTSGIGLAIARALAGQGSKSTGIVLGREMIVTADMLRQLLPISPDLVFVNCCYLGTMDPNPAHLQAHAFAASIAEISLC